MSDRFTVSVGQAHELELAMDRVGGWTPALVKELCKSGNLAEIREVLLGFGEIHSCRSIDCDADPFVLEGLSVETHQKGGILRWDPKQAQLYFPRSQEGGKPVRGDEIRQELTGLAGKQVLNACVLDWLLKYPYLIPAEWKRIEHGRAPTICFWGTIYRSPDLRRSVRYLYYGYIGGSGWNTGYYGIDYANLGDNSPAALRVLPPAEVQAA